jgi:hypothetical protein
VIRRGLLVGVAALSIAVAAPAVEPPPASANVAGVLCSVGGWLVGAVGKACNVASHLGKALGAGRKLLGGAGGGRTVAGVGAAATAEIAFRYLGGMVAGGASAALREAASVIGHTTEPDPTASWFQSTYLRVALLAALLALPFLFAAAIQAVLRSDPLLLARAALADLPLAMLAVFTGGQLTKLLIGASDWMCTVVASAAGAGPGRFLLSYAAITGGFSAGFGSAFVALLAGILVVLAGLVLSLELLLREAAVYVVVLLLPLVFAGLVWPARRRWVTRSLELLVALVLSKFVIVAVLVLAFAAFHGIDQRGIAPGIVGMALLMMSVFSPWALMRLLPMAEVAASVHGMLRNAGGEAGRAVDRSHEVEGLLSGLGVSSRPDGVPRDDAPADQLPPDPDDRARGTEEGARPGGGPADEGVASPQPGDDGSKLDAAGHLAPTGGSTGAGGTVPAPGDALAAAGPAPGAATPAASGPLAADPADAGPHAPGVKPPWPVPEGEIIFSQEALTMPWTDDDDPRPIPQGPPEGRP